MRDDHIISLLDSERFGSLSLDDRQRIDSHIRQCESCRQADAAAQVAAMLLQTRAGEIIEPSPFFSTRVMAALRQRPHQSPLSDLVGSWQSMRGLLFTALSAVVLLAGLTFIVPATNSERLAFGNYSTEGVVFGDESASNDDGDGNEQVMDVVFTSEDTDATNGK